MTKRKQAWWAAGWLGLAIMFMAAAMACNLRTAPSGVVEAYDAPQTQGAALMSASSVTAVMIGETATPVPTVTPLPSATATTTASPTPFGCEQPPDDLTRVMLPVGFEVNQRTVWMLERAQALYGGTHDLIRAVTQGSYNVGVTASFGTHDGGGAVDLALRSLTDWHHILYEEADAIILALRRAGFAAWVRDTDSLYPGSPVHIHAIAIGDADLSPAAASQLTGPEGYFRGFNGLPENIQPDPHGGPVVCPWMIEMGLGYGDLRANPQEEK